MLEITEPRLLGAGQPGQGGLQAGMTQGAQGVVDAVEQIAIQAQAAMGQPLAGVDVVGLAPGDDLLHHPAAALVDPGRPAQGPGGIEQQSTGTGREMHGASGGLNQASNWRITS